MERSVVVAGWGQVIQPKNIRTIAEDPMGLMIRASVKAASRITPGKILSTLDGIMVVKTLSHYYSSPADDLALELGASPQLKLESGIGGNSPQTLINMAAGMIARRELDAVLIAGAETYVQRNERSGKVNHALFRGVPENYKGDDLIGTTALERNHGIAHPMQGFPLYETALWGASGLNLDTYLKKVGTMWASFSRIASGNPYAWSRVERTCEQIITPGVANRLIAFPYTKYMNAYVTVDQGAAIILAAEEKAEELSGGYGKTVYFLGGGFARDRQRFMIEKSDFTASQPLKQAVEKALERSNICLEQIECFDLYSCFPSAVTIAKKMIGIDDDDPRPLTLTGGLGFFGGPGNNYSLHSVAALAEKISNGEKNNGLVTALGWFMHKHAAGIYSNRPLGGRFEDYDLTDQQDSPAGRKPVRIQDKVDAGGIIETYTVVYSPDNHPAYAVIYGRTEAGFRFVAKTENKAAVFSSLMAESRVGKRVAIRFDATKKVNIARLRF